MNLKTRKLLEQILMFANGVINLPEQYKKLTSRIKVILIDDKPNKSDQSRNIVQRKSDLLLAPSLEIQKVGNLVGRTQMNGKHFVDTNSLIYLYSESEDHKRKTA